MLASGEPIPPVPDPTLLAVARANYRVSCLPLEPWQYDWLVLLPDDPAQAVPADARVAGWLPFAMAQGLVASG